MFREPVRLEEWIALDGALAVDTAMADAFYALDEFVQGRSVIADGAMLTGVFTQTFTETAKKAEEAVDRRDPLVKEVDAYRTTRTQ